MKNSIQGRLFQGQEVVDRITKLSDGVYRYFEDQLSALKNTMNSVMFFTMFKNYAIAWIMKLLKINLHLEQIHC